MAEWVALAERLLVAGGQEKFAEVLSAVREATEAQEIIARFDWQLMLRKRPQKLYKA